MKAERRHELQHNVLDNELAKLVEFFRRRGSYIAWGIIIVLLVSLVGTYAVRQNRQKRRELQVSYERLTSSFEAGPAERIEGLGSLARQTKDRRIAALAAIALGDLYARHYVEGTAAPGEDAASVPEQAKRHYEGVLERFGDDPVATAKARIGLAKLNESLGDFDTARRQYEAITQMPNLAGQPAMLLAEEALTRLDEYSTPVPMATTRPAREEADSPDDGAAETAE